MTTRRAFLSALAAVAVARPAAAQPSFTSDPLPSWNPGDAKREIIIYVSKVTREGKGFVPPEERVAVFDNDGTLWCEQPVYAQLAFVFDRIGDMAAKDSSLLANPAFKAMAAKDMAAVARLGPKDLLAAMAASQAGLTPEAYRAVAADWLAKARHPRFNVPYTALVYQPQLDLLAYLRANGFATWIVSGGDVEFMRAFAQATYGIPPEQVIGSSQKTDFTLNGPQGSVVETAGLNSLDDGPAKASNIALHIGRPALVAVGNSDGDQQMLEYSASSARPNLQILIHHDDAAREYAYDRTSAIGKLDKALDEARPRGWTVVSMKSDWKTVFPA